MPKQFYSKVELKESETTDGNLIIEVLGNPYQGPDYLEGKDFSGEFFSKDTDFGDEISSEAGQVIYATLGHAVAKDANGEIYMHPMKMFIGQAKYAKTDELGRWYEIEVTRGERYQEVIRDLAAKEMLFASSQPIQTSVTMKETGEITSWINAEIALTTRADNPNAQAKIQEVYKSVEITPDFGVNLDWEVLLKELEPKDESEIEAKDADVEGEPEVDINAKEASEVQDGDQELSLDEHITKAMSGTITDANGDSYEIIEGGGYGWTETTIVTTFDIIKKYMEDMDERLKTLEGGLTDTREDVKKSNDKLENGLRVFATEFGKQLNNISNLKARDMLSEMSEAEIEAERLKSREVNNSDSQPRSYVSVVPAGAPGS